MEQAGMPFISNIAAMTPNDGVTTHSWLLQANVEYDLIKIDQEHGANAVDLDRSAHVEFVRRGLVEGLENGFSSLDASQPWLVYWMVHSLDLLNADDIIGDVEFRGRVASTLSAMQDRRRGGFGGGPGQRPHLAATFAAVSALAVVGRLHDVVDLDGVRRFLLSMKDPESGGFRVTASGEMDARGTYCALAVASLCDILTPELAKNARGFLATLQSFDGGIAGERGNEPHGGYAYCALAAASILAQSPSAPDITSVSDVFNREALLRWLAMRQMPFEGGFQGRPNKLVDACYAFWVAGAFPVIAPDSARVAVRARTAPLARYLLRYCQAEMGGMRDKPRKAPDYYHTCYALSGLSIARHYGLQEDGATGAWGGPIARSIAKTDPVYNIRVERLEALRSWQAEKRALAA